MLGDTRAYLYTEVVPFWGSYSQQIGNSSWRVISELFDAGDIYEKVMIACH